MTRSRRDFLKLSALSGAALVLRVPVLSGEQPKAGARVEPFAPNKWLSIDAGGKVTFVTARSEMGQGARTSLAMILAEETRGRLVEDNDRPCDPRREVSRHAHERLLERLRLLAAAA